MLIKKLLRDMRKNLLSSITIVIITSLGIMFWSGFDGVYSNMSRIISSFYEDALMPDLFISGSRLTVDDIRALRRNGAERVMGRNTIDMFASDYDDAVLRI